MGKAAAAVVVAVNGQRYEAAGVDPSTTLLEFLRTQTPVRGPKLGCGEGTIGQMRLFEEQSRSGSLLVFFLYLVSI